MVHEEENQQPLIMGSNTNSGGWSRCSKKPKLHKVPQRGPGVAELEKILREQQKNVSSEEVADARPSPSLVSPVTHGYQHPPPPPPLATSTINISSSSFLTRPVPLIPNLDLFSSPPLPIAQLYGNGCSTNSLGGGGSACVAAIGGSVSTSPGDGYFPTMWSSRESNYDGEGPKLGSGFPFSTHIFNRSKSIWPSSLLLQGKLCHDPPSMMNLSPFSSSAGLNHHIEPPSNQRYSSNCTSIWPEEEKMVGMNQLRWPFSIDNPPGPFFHYKIPPIVPHTHRSDQSCSCSNDGGFNLDPSKIISRNTKSGGLSELNSKTCITDYGPLDGKFLTLGPPATPSPSTQTFNWKFYESDSPPFQGSMDDPSQWSGSGGSVHQKPFYSFLLPKGQMGRAETTLSLSNGRGEAAGDSIDLNLKL